MTVKRLKNLFLKGFILSTFIFLVVLCGSRGFERLFKDLGDIFVFLTKYFVSNFYPAKILSIIVFAGFIITLILAIVFIFNKKKKRNLFGIVLILGVIYILGICLVHTKEINMVFDSAYIPNKTLGAFIITFGVLSLVCLGVYGGLLTRDLILVLNAENLAAKQEKARKLRQKERVEELKKQFAEAKEKRQKEAEKYDDFEIEASSPKEESQVETKAEPQKEAKPKKSSAKSESKKRNNVESFVEEYNLTEEGYLPLDDMNRNPQFEATLNASGQRLKNIFSEIKNAIVCYPGVSETKQKTMVTYKVDKTTVARIVFYERGFKLYVAMDPYTVDANAYCQYDAFEKYNDTPCALHIYNKASLNKAKDIINQSFEGMELTKDSEYVEQDFTSLDDSGIE
ncbi:MAG: hypothetical protein ACI4U5_06600 [Bacilli bacterium]